MTPGKLSRGWIVLAVIMLVAPAAQANFHFMQIEQVSRVNYFCRLATTIFAGCHPW